MDTKALPSHIIQSKQSKTIAQFADQFAVGSTMSMIFFQKCSKLFKIVQI